MISKVKAIWENGDLVFQTLAGTEIARFDESAESLNISQLAIDGTVVTATAAQLNALAIPATIDGAAIGTSVITDSIICQTDLNQHDYAAGHADWMLSAAEQQGMYFEATNADQAAKAIVPTRMRLYVFKNNSGQAITVKTAAGTGIAVANTKSAVLFCNGTNVIRITADA